MCSRRIIVGQVVKAVVTAKLKDPVLSVSDPIPKRSFLLEALDFKAIFPGEDFLAGYFGFDACDRAFILDALHEGCHGGSDASRIELVESGCFQLPGGRAGVQSLVKVWV